ncbi:hypothetical protein [Thiofilum flexile]|uniref:hypothetical protein n=1 Tax=Thiofilum flexile TaxID=125627 RepID=UPI00038016F2|nr:hypothetical protein [Thiofilum flexile]
MIFPLILALIITIIISLFYHSKIKKFKKDISGNKSDFWLSIDEKNNFKNTHKEYSNTKDIIDNAHNRAVAAGVMKNKDGNYSAKSKIGKEVIAILDRYEEPFTDLKNKLDKVKTMPLQRWTEFNKTIKIYNFFTYLAATFSLFIAILITLFFANKIVFIGILKNELVLSIILLIIVLLFIYEQAKDRATAFTPKPPIVSHNNIDDY